MINIQNIFKITSIPSRFYNIILDFSEYDKNINNILCIDNHLNLNPLDKLNYWCNCKSGARTVSPCSHIISVLKLFLCIKNNEYNFKTKHNQIIKSSIIDGKQYKVWEKEHTFVDCKKPSEMNCYNKPPKRQKLNEDTIINN